MEKKMTKKDFYENLIEIVNEKNNEGVLENGNELIEFLNKQIELINSKAEKAKERNAEKKAKGDALREVVLNLLTDEFQTIDAIMTQIDNPDGDITRAKVTARLTALCKNNMAENTEVKDSEGRKLKAYRVINLEEVEDNE